MGKVIEDLWYGNIDPRECGKLNCSADMKKKSEHMVRHMDELRKGMTKE